jgi:hypothetical protein
MRVTVQHRLIKCVRASAVAVATLAVTASAGAAVGSASAAGASTTAWSSGSFHVNRRNIVERSDTILGSPNEGGQQALGLGNGSVGAAVWAAGGFTTQVNRDDTFPNRKSPGQVTIPGLATMTAAADFTARLNVYDGVLTESGGGMTATIYVRADKDEIVVDVTGADPASTQTASAALWDGRSPTSAVAGTTGTLAETWVDSGTGGTGKTFGSLLAITAGGKNITATRSDAKKVDLRFNPNPNGTFRVLIGAPHWTGGNAATAASTLFGSDATATSASVKSAHLTWWHSFWRTADMVEINSADGSGQYMENLRTLYLYDEASLVRGTYPGTQAGLANLFAWDQDSQPWESDDYWFWNQRMQIAANLSSGESALNAGYFNLYTSNIANLKTWTAAHMPGHSGICVPETMRFNGNGAYGESTGNTACDGTIAPSYNSLTITTGAEVSLWIWQQYLTTRNASFLKAGYPVMKAAAQFLLSYATLGADGKLHTRANAHETQWDVTDPITDIAAMQAVFPMVKAAAKSLGVDSALQAQLTTALTEIPPLPRTDEATHSSVLTPGADAGGKDVFAYSTEPAATQRNDENLDLEPTYPYGLIGDSPGTLNAVANRTWTSRQHVDTGDWAYDGLQAARLGRASDVKDSLVTNVEHTQVYANGLADLNGSATGAVMPYVEEQGIVAATVNEALAQDYDGLIRVAPAWPTDWDADGSVAVQHKSTVDVQVRGGTPVTVVLEAGATATMRMRSPWPGKAVKVVEAVTNRTVIAATTASTLSIGATSGHKYLIELSGAPFTKLPFAEVTGTPAVGAKHLGSRQIGTDGTGSGLHRGSATSASPRTLQRTTATAVANRLHAAAEDSTSRSGTRAQQRRALPRLGRLPRGTRSPIRKDRESITPPGQMSRSATDFSARRRS